MDLRLFVACFGIAVFVTWKYFGGREAKTGNPKVGYQREEFEIDPNSVPEFKSSIVSRGRMTREIP